MTENNVIRSLSRKHDIRISGRQIQVLKGDRAINDLGNTSWGKIDFLSHYCGYSLWFVKKFD